MNSLAVADILLRIIDLALPHLTRASAELARLRAMVAEGREPTREEWDALFAELEGEGARLRAAIDALEARGA